MTAPNVPQQIESAPVRQVDIQDQQVKGTVLQRTASLGQRLA